MPAADADAVARALSVPAAKLAPPPRRDEAEAVTMAVTAVAFCSADADGAVAAAAAADPALPTELLLHCARHADLLAPRTSRVISGWRFFGRRGASSYWLASEVSEFDSEPELRFSHPSSLSFRTRPSRRAFARW